MVLPTTSSFTFSPGTISRFITEHPSEIDLSYIIVSFAVTISFFPAIAAALDPIFNQRTTLRDVLFIYKVVFLAGCAGFPAFYLIIERQPQICFFRTSCALFLALLVAFVGLSWYIVLDGISTIRLMWLRRKIARLSDKIARAEARLEALVKGEGTR